MLRSTFESVRGKATNMSKKEEKITGLSIFFLVANLSKYHIVRETNAFKPHEGYDKGS